MYLVKNENGYYEARIKSQDGKTHSISTGQKNKDEAKRAAKAARISEIEKAAELGILTHDAVAIVLSGKKATVSNSIKPFRQWLQMQNQSQRSIESCISWLLAWAEYSGRMNGPLGAVRMEHIHAWVNDPASTRKASTRAVMLSALRSFFKFVSAQGWITGNPAALVSVDLSILSHEQKEKDVKQPFTDEEFKALIDATSPSGSYPNAFWHFAITASRCYGLRLGDICGLEWDSVNQTNGAICVWTEKRDKRVTPALMEPENALGCWTEALYKVEKTSEKYLFPTQRCIHLDPNSRSTLSVQFIRICEKLGIEGKTFHCLRASYCTACDKAGVPIEHIARHVGHSDAATTKGYIRLVKS